MEDIDRPEWPPTVQVEVMGYLIISVGAMDPSGAILDS